MNLETFDLSIFVEVPAPRVAKAWKSSMYLQHWLLLSANFVTDSGDSRAIKDPCKTGDMYWWEWVDRSIETGSILEASPNHLRFTYGAGVEVSVRWKAVADGTIVVLNQFHSIPDEEKRLRTYTKTLQNWTFHLTNLKAYLEHGIDLRDRAPTRLDHANV